MDIALTKQEINSKGITSIESATIQQNSKKIISQNQNEMQNQGVPWHAFTLFYFPFALIFISLIVEYYYQNVFFPIWVAYVIIPILDYVLPHDNYNLPENQIRTYEKDKRFLIPLYAAWIIDFYTYFYAMTLISKGMMPQGPAYFFLYSFCIANCGALNLSIGHELAHRKELIHKICGNLVYSKMFYSHFIIQHIKSHHKKVATPEDPSTSRKGESIWDFLYRTLPEGYAETWELEKTRLALVGKSPYSLENKLILWNIGHILWLGVIYFAFGKLAAIFQISTSILNIIYFETINYIEHYGLQRKKDVNGNYESVKITHSWNAPQVASNYLLFKLQRHSDHHANSYKPYQILESLPESPNLPFGYTASFLLSFVPFVWFKVMDPYVDACNKGEKIDEKLKKELDKWIFGTLFGISILFTYINFWLVGFQYRF
ncbi:alkane 1-monooxygenase [Stylonychia lemnae]|uniref:Alkane 1-monooxygenase n=1 Tax=Stylonychia lemnae TaxID=5949 RepID=A0A077ZTT9_STYLE|nr:alkane 1-monooxygenase [Stylonychia lemnae]|eukprot:CDW72740.1 alkane 1-monooxygenase [Stylonychia lemnae]